MHEPGIEAPLLAEAFAAGVLSAAVASEAVTSWQASTDVITASLLGEGEADGEFEALGEEPPQAERRRSPATKASAARPVRILER